MRQSGVDRWYPSVVRDAFHGFLLGEKLGQGLSRNIYAYGIDDDLVIKIETGVGYHQNIIEWHTWNALLETKVKKHFARCVQISQDGHFLLMERTSEPPQGYKYPEKMPSICTDFKESNYGLTKKGDLVCHDYGTNLAITNGISMRMRKAHWWT